MIAVAVPTVTPLLERTARRALLATADGPLELLVVWGTGMHGEKLDRALAMVTPGTEWLFTMDDDAVPLRRGWDTWLCDRIGSRNLGGFWAAPRGNPHPLGAMYRTEWLRKTRRSFTPQTIAGEFFDVGQSIGLGEPAFIAAPAPRSARPWWLRRADAAVDDAGRLIFAHLGGGTVGYTSWRVPNWTWPWLVRWQLRQTTR